MALSANDRVEIMQLVARYNQAIDARDGEAWAKTFSEDGVFVAGTGSELRGQAALGRMVKELPPGNQRHWTLNCIIEGDGERATLRADFAALRENKIDATGRYDDELVKVQGAWRFRGRHFTPDLARSEQGPQ